MRIIRFLLFFINKNQKNLRVQYNILKKMSRYLLTLTNVNERNIESPEYELFLIGQCDSACKNN